MGRCPWRPKESVGSSRARKKDDRIWETASEKEMIHEARTDCRSGVGGRPCRL